ncbi:MAG: SpoIID/LytB domain-containing protein [bacterium]
MTTKNLGILFALAFASASCGEVSMSEDPSNLPGFNTRVFHLEAPCMVMVDGVGMVDVENDYIPGVVACENGNAPLEALKAQAVQARGFLYYKLFVAGATSIGNSQSDQVYSCTSRLPNGPLAIHREAAAATKGQYLTWKDRIIAPFYVAGAIPPNPDPEDPINSCRGNGGADGTNTERWVTYNWGKSNCDIELTALGFVPADCNGNPANRGCASQNGESCLARTGVKYPDMFEYYYGDDIQLVVSTGQCGGPPIEPITDYDRFCGLKTDGSYCFDAATRVDCVAEYSAAEELCGGSCENGACVGAVEPTGDSCADAADGAYCLDNVTRIECAAGAVSLSEVCESGCIAGECATDPIEGNVDDPVVVDPGVDEGKQEVVSDFPGLVSASSGSSEGCNSIGAPVSLLALGVLGLLRRR